MPDIKRLQTRTGGSYSKKLTGNATPLAHAHTHTVGVSLFLEGDSLALVRMKVQTRASLTLLPRK